MSAVRRPRRMATRGAREHRVIRGVRVTIGAGVPHSLAMRACGDRELGMRERRPCPLRRRMARCAGRREASRRVVRIRSGVVFRLVTAIAVLWRPFEYAVYVATRTCRCRMFAGQREGCGAVIECRSWPLGRVVASLASLWESRRRMIRAARRLVLRQVT
jgi:hypothetical protein